MRRYRFAVLVSLLLVPRLASPQGEPLGAEFRVNTDTSSSQRSSSVASAGDDFVVVWDSGVGDGPRGGLGVRAQRYDSGGSPLGTEFRVNTFTTLTQQGSAVGANASGTFVVVWYSSYSIGPDSNVFGQRYDASGAPGGPEFFVSTAGQDVEGDPAVAVAPSGAFLVVWSWTPFYVPPDPPLPGDVFARRYDNSGVPQGPPFRVNTFTTNSQREPSVSADPLGNFMVVWSSAQDGSSYGVFGQRYAASGIPLGPEFRVNTYTSGSQRGPAVAADPFGSFVVAWASDSSGNPGLFAQRFASSGAPLGPEFRVSASTTGSSYGPAIAVDGGGNFVIAWVNTPAYAVSEVFGQRYSSLGDPSGTEFRVNTTTTGPQGRPSVASTPNGTFLVTWDSSPIPDNQLRDVFGQRFGGVFPVKLHNFRVE